MHFEPKDPRLLRAALACFALALIPLGLLIALNGCASPVAIGRDGAITIFQGGAEGTSNDPVRFPSPLVTIRKPWPPSLGEYAARLDRVGFGWRVVLHEVVAGPLPDGSYLMQGHNRATNPKPDAIPLTPANYIGTAFPIHP